MGARSLVCVAVAQAAVLFVLAPSASATFPGANGRLAIALGSPSGPGGPTTIATLNADGSRLRRLRAGADPVWRPDGRRIEFVQQRVHGPWRTATMNADGTHVRHRAIRDAPGRRPVTMYSTSPDGRHIAYNVRLPRTSGDGWALYVARPDGASPRRLLVSHNHYADFGTIRWSPDGRTIACVEGAFRVWLVPVDGSGAHAVAGDPTDAQADHPRWAPDGSLLLTLHQRSGPASAQVLADGTGLHTLTTTVGTRSPDNALTAYLTAVDVINQALTVAAADGSNPRVILTGHIEAVDWQPRP